MLPARYVRASLLALGLVAGLAAPALAADLEWPAGDPTWQTADPSWLQQNWQWQAYYNAGWIDPNGRPIAPPAMSMRAPSAYYVPATNAYPQPPMRLPYREAGVYPYWPQDMHFDIQLALVSASAHGDLAMVKALVARGGNVNLRDAEGYTPLTWAAQRGQTSVVAYLLEHWANPNPADRVGYTPLMWAAQEGQAETAKVLLAHGANPFVTDHRGLTPLGLARMSGNATLVGYLQTAMATSPASRRSLPTPP